MPYSYGSSVAYSAKVGPCYSMKLCVLPLVCLSLGGPAAATHRTQFSTRLHVTGSSLLTALLSRTDDRRLVTVLHCVQA